MQAGASHSQIRVVVKHVSPRLAGGSRLLHEVVRRGGPHHGSALEMRQFVHRDVGPGGTLAHLQHSRTSVVMQRGESRRILRHSGRQNVLERGHQVGVHGDRSRRVCVTRRRRPAAVVVVQHVCGLERQELMRCCCLLRRCCASIKQEVQGR